MNCLTIWHLKNERDAAMGEQKSNDRRSWADLLHSCWPTCRLVGKLLLNNVRKESNAHHPAEMVLPLCRLLWTW